MRTGDGDCLEALVRRHEHAVLRVAARVTGDADDAADVRQRVFLGLIEGPPETDIADLLAYLARAAANAALAPDQRAALALRFDGGLTFAQVAAASGEPVSTVKGRTRTALARLRALLAAPPPRVRESPR